MIVLSFIQLPQSDPPNPAELPHQQRRPTEGVRFRIDFDESRVLFPAKVPNNPALPLLLTNHQLHAETLDILRRAFPPSNVEPPSYTADILYLKDTGALCPTWLSVPRRAAHVDTLHVQFRISNSPCDPDLLVDGIAVPAKVFNNDNDMWTLYHLFISAIATGTYPPCGGPITVKRLVLDFLPAGVDVQDLLPMGPVVKWEWSSGDNPRGPDVYARDMRKEVSEAMRLDPNLEGSFEGDPGREAAARLMCYFMKWLRIVSGTRDYTWKRGKVLMEHIGGIEFCLDGVLYETLDLGRRLANATRWGGGVESYRQRMWYGEFLPWRERTLARRRELGMSAPTATTGG